MTSVMSGRNRSTDGMQVLHLPHAATGTMDRCLDLQGPHWATWEERTNRIRMMCRTYSTEWWAKVTIAPVCATLGR